MHKALIATAPHVASLAEYSDRELGPDEALIRTLFASPKHGTDLSDFRGESAFMDEKFDPEWNMFVPRAADEPRGVLFGSWIIGNMFAGRITRTGRDEIGRASWRERVYI